MTSPDPTRSGRFVAAVFVRLACALALGVVVMAAVAATGFARDLAISGFTATTAQVGPGSPAERSEAVAHVMPSFDLDDPFRDGAPPRVVSASGHAPTPKPVRPEHGPSAGKASADPLERPPRS